MSLTVLGTENTNLNKADTVLSQRVNSLVEVTEEQTGNYKTDVVKNRWQYWGTQDGVSTPELVSKGGFQEEVTPTWHLKDEQELASKNEFGFGWG